MKNLNVVELNHVCGGEAFLITTTRINVANIPKACIDTLVQNNSNFSFVDLNEDTLNSQLCYNCKK